MGNVLLTQADAKVVDFSTFTGCEIQGVGGGKISMTAPTTAKDMIDGSGSLTIKDIDLEVTQSANISAVQQSAVLSTTGTINICNGSITYTNSGSYATARKSAVRPGASGIINLLRVIGVFTVSNTAQYSVFADETTGEVNLTSCYIDMIVADSTYDIGWYAVKTGTRFFQFNYIHINGVGAHYNVNSNFASATTIYGLSNILKSTSGTGTYGYNVDSDCTLYSITDNMVGQSFPYLGIGATIYPVGSTGGTSLITNSITSRYANADLSIVPDGSGNLILDQDKWPQVAGTAGAKLIANGSGQCIWEPGGYFGTQSASYASSGSSSTNSTSYASAHKITQTDYMIAGTYAFLFSAAFKISNAATYAACQATIGGSQVKEAEEPSQRLNSFSHVEIYEHTVSGNLNFTIDYRTNNASYAANI